MCVGRDIFLILKEGFIQLLLMVLMTCRPTGKSNPSSALMTQTHTPKSTHANHCYAYLYTNTQTHMHTKGKLYRYIKKAKSVAGESDKLIELQIQSCKANTQSLHVSGCWTSDVRICIWQVMSPLYSPLTITTITNSNVVRSERQQSVTNTFHIIPENSSSHTMP